MKTGLVLEGGAMRGMFTAGVIDVLLENKITVDTTVGVSAGAVFGCNYKSQQIGRVIRYNKKYCKDPRYASFRSLIKTGDLYGEQFCYHEIPDKLDPFDIKAFSENPMDFYVVTTDVNTGKPIYHLCKTGDKKDLQWMRASASMPLASRIVSVDGYDMLDGGIADSIPLSWLLSQGFEKAIVVLTQHNGYRKKKNSMLPLIKAVYRRYPKLIETMQNRHVMYNAKLDKIASLERRGKILVVRPDEPINISRTEKDPEKLECVYQLGRRNAIAKLDQIKEFLSQ